MSNFKRDNNAGLYLTISFHLIVLIIFLLYSINYVVQTETSFVLDFTRAEELAEEIRKQEFQESVGHELDAQISQTAAPRNVITDANTPLKDAHTSEPDQIYDDIQELQEKLDASKAASEMFQETEDMVAISDQEEKSEETYIGPSVVSYRVDGRKALNLPIPAYKCIAGGDVTVAIIVNERGYVKAVKIIKSVSSSDNCLQEYALKAAQRSRFTSLSTAQKSQAGEIVYRFVAQ